MGYVWSPLAPSRSGIARYSETLIADDPDLEDLTFVTPDERQRNGRRAVPPDGAVRVEDRALLQLGNGVDEGYVFERALLGGAVVELHDLSLHQVHAHLTLGQKDFPGYLAGLQTAEGEWGRRAAFQRAKGYYTPRLEAYMRVNKSICERARAVIVHSKWAKFQIELQDVDTPVHVVPHFALAPEESQARSVSRAQARAHLGLDQDRFVVLVAGTVTPENRMDWVLDAVDQLSAEGANIQVIVVGDGPSESMIDRVARSSQSSRVELTGHVDARTFDEYMLAADIVAMLRFPSLGGFSGTVARALGFGRVRSCPNTRLSRTFRIRCVRRFTWTTLWCPRSQPRCPDTWKARAVKRSWKRASPNMHAAICRWIKPAIV